MANNTQAIFHRYDNIKGVHRRLRAYVADWGLWKINYFVAHLSHDIYKSKGINGHLERQRIRDGLRKMARNIYNNK